MADPRKEIARALRADEWVQRHLGIVAHADDVADTAVAALEAAGFILLPPGGEVSEEVARGIFGVDYRRSVRFWPDGSKLFGPWEVVSDNQADRDGEVPDPQSKEDGAQPE